MNITPGKQEGLNYEYQVVVSAADLESQMESELQSIGRKAKIPGFRPGKVPMRVLKQKYGKNVMGEVIENSINNAARQVFEKEKVRPALKPDIQVTNYEEGGDLSFDMKFEALPDVPEQDISSIKIEKQVCKMTDEEYNEALENIRSSHKHFHPAKEGTAAKLGDAVKINFLGKVDGEAFDGGKGEGFQLELGSGQFIPGFEDELVGCKAGDKKDVKVTFPESYHAEALAGKPAVFETEVLEVLTAETHDEVDDEFARHIGFPTLEALKDAITAQIQGEYDRQSREKCKKQLFDALDEVVKFDVPQSMVKMEFDNIWQQIEQAKEQGDEELKGKSDTELKEEYEAVAERRVRLGIYLSEVANKNNLKVTREEISAAVISQARMFPGQEDKVFQFYKENPAEVEQLKGPILEEKSVDYLLGKVKVEEKEVDAETLAAQDDEPAKPAKKSAAKKSAKAKDDAESKDTDKSEKKAAPKKKAAKKAS